MNHIQAGLNRQAAKQRVLDAYAAVPGRKPLDAKDVQVFVSGNELTRCRIKVRITRSGKRSGAAS